MKRQVSLSLAKSAAPWRRRLLSTLRDTTRHAATLSQLLALSLAAQPLLAGGWDTLVLSSLVVKVSCKSRSYVTFPLTGSSGAASDKVTALEKAGVIVTNSPAKIGAEMLKVCLSMYMSAISMLTRVLTGNESGWFGVDLEYPYHHNELDNRCFYSYLYLNLDGCFQPFT
jgi:hypothetical protein